MAWVQFSSAYIYTPSRDRRVAIAYPAGHKGSVPAECAAKAVASGVARRIRTPNRSDRDQAGEVAP